MRSFVAFLALNGIDTVLTVVVLRAGLATEINPVMAELYSVNLWVFVFAKLFLVAWLAGALWSWKHMLWVRAAIWVVLALYSLVVARDLWFLALS